MRRLTSLLCTLLIALTACTTEEPASRGPDPDGRDAVDAGGADARVMLRPFASCDDLLAYYRDHAADLVGPYGLGGSGSGLETEVMAVAAEDSDGRAVAAAAPATGDGQAVSGTNVQEVGIDEPDLVKTDGDVIVTTVTGRVHVVDVATEQVLATVDPPGDAFGAELLLDGDTLLVMSVQHGFAGPQPHVDGDALLPAFSPQRTVLTRVDLSDPSAPVVIGSVQMEGAYRSARMIDGTVRVVMVSEPPGLAFTAPADGSLTAEADAEARNRQIVAESALDDWVPHVQVLDAAGAPDGPVQPLLDCATTNRPAEFAGLSTMSVLTLDLRGDGLLPGSTAGLVASGDTVYASTDRLIVATSPWGGWVVPFAGRLGAPEEQEVATDLHSFDIADPGTTRYAASGRVAGTLLNQFALSEVAGIIRVATTTGSPWFGGDEESQSSLVVLAERGEDLVEVGRLDGLGVTERIHAVRYLGPDLAAIVTFRQVDPLYLVDTADPVAPRLLGELKIPGYSAYLHPVADGWLIGVGQDADETTGMVEGLQVSLFDIRDPAAPQRVAQVDIGQGWSPVEGDHRAFLHWAPTGQVVVPAELWTSEPLDPAGGAIAPEGQGFTGAIVLDVGGFDATGSLAEAGRVANRDVGPGQWAPGVVRSLVIGEDLWTLSHEDLARHDLAGLARQSTVPLR